jgi:deoxyribodipyrimidine photo-lyase
MLPSISLLRYKKDLRIADHAPLWNACQQDFPVVALYIREPHIMEADDYSHFHQYRIQESIKDLKYSLSQLNIPLLMRYGEFDQALAYIQQYYTIKHIYAHEETGNHLTYMRDLAMIKYCKSNHITFTEYPTNAVVRKLRSRDDWGKHHKERIFAPMIALPQTKLPFELHASLLQVFKESFQNFVPATKPSTYIYDRDKSGETQAQARLSHFLKNA